MWVFTTSGFVSAVFKDGAIQVRARDHKSLEPLAKQTGAAIVATPLADYPYRIAITNEQFASWVINKHSPSLTKTSNLKSQIRAVTALRSR